MQSNHANKKKNGGRKGHSDKTGLDIVVNPRNESRFFQAERQGKPAVLRRKLTSVVNVSATAAAVFAYAHASGSVVTATEWAALSPNYQQYRVRAVRVTLVPLNFMNNGFAATVWYPGTVVSGRYPSGSSASGVVAMWSQGGAKLHSCLDKRMVNMATMDDNPDAALFTDCVSGAPPALSQYGVQFVGGTVAPAIYNAVITHDAYIEYDVEFIGRN